MFRWVNGVFAMILFFIPVEGFAAVDDQGEVQAAASRHIARIIDAGSATKAFTCSKERVCGISVIPGFYKQRNYIPVWTNNGRAVEQTGSLLKALLSAHEEGLSPEIYHLGKIRPMLAAIHLAESRSKSPDPEIVAEMDILMTDAFLLFASHLKAGRVNPETIHTAWVAYLPEIDLARVLASAIKTDQVAERLKSLNPPHDGYVRLKNALHQYRRIARSGSWIEVPQGPALKLGDRNERVRPLRKRLLATGDLKTDVPKNREQYDVSVDTAVRRFQYRHGLEVDGIVGKRTLSALNQTVDRRIRQIELNLERWRWIPSDLGRRHILVNIANYHLSVVETDDIVLEMRVVVGRHYRRTPVFTETIKYLVINPFWNVPFNIAVRDKLPLIKEDPAYLKNNRFTVFSGWENKPKKIDPESLNWNQITRDNFVYRFRQDPGPDNALGRIKFMFPNRFSVYMHDTPQRELFNETIRTFSSGCIRLEKPLKLAAYLLSDDANWDLTALEHAIEDGRSRAIALKRPVPVHLHYWTAWVDVGGTVHFRDDIYNRDLPLDQALKEKLPDP